MSGFSQAASMACARTRWIRRPRPCPRASLRLLCLPHAGGTPALYRPWVPLLPPAVEPLLVCPPGREDRLDDPFPKDIPALVSDLAEVVEPLLDRPWVLFGHSMGAAVGFELALILRRRPEMVVLSAREPPHLHRGGGVHGLDDDALCAELIRLGGTHPDLLRSPEVRAVVLPAVREDYRLIETYHAHPEGRLDCPLAVFRGREDADLTEQEALEWRAWSTGSFTMRAFSGGHFYLRDHPGPVVGALGALLPGL